MFYTRDKTMFNTLTNMAQNN